jgi:hypothetical protein
MWWVWWIACAAPFEWLSDLWSGPDECAEPHLYYAPDGSSDVYFGCDPPLGWLETPPDEVEFVPVAPALPAAEAGPEIGVGDTGLPIYVGTGVTGETSDTARGERQAAPSPGNDTSLPPLDSWDTAADPRLPVDTSDTGAVPMGDTADTGLLPPAVDTALPLHTGAAGGTFVGGTGAPVMDTGILEDAP